MKRRIVILTLALVIIMTLTACAALTPTGLTKTDNGTLPPASAEGTGDDLTSHGPEETAGGEAQTPPPDHAAPEVRPLKAEPAAGVTLNTKDHVVYVTGNGSGYFNPGDHMTRAQIAVVLYRLLSEKAPVTVSYPDVPENSWYTDAALQLGSLGVLRAGERTFRGDEYITRGEFAHCIAAFFPMRTDAKQFSDVPSTYRYADDILSCRAYGWLTGYSDGTFRAEQPIQRCEAVAFINRALGRTGDRECIEKNRPALFLDVPVNAWYYYDVMEVAVPHSFTAGGDGTEKWTAYEEAGTSLPKDFRTQGFHLYQGWCYYYSTATKDIFRSRTVSGFTYDADGHFTTGDTWVDQQLREIILSRTDPDMTRDQMLRALFAYCRDNYKYLRWNIYSAGDTSFMLDAARHMLSTGRGNCYCYASVFWYLARWLGYDAEIFSGAVLGGPHSWVEIDGYIYDTQLEWRYVHDWGRSQYLWTFYHLQDSRDTYRYRK